MAVSKDSIEKILNNMDTSKYYTCKDFRTSNFKFLDDTNTDDISTMLSLAYWRGKLDRRNSTSSYPSVRFEYIRRDSAPRTKPKKTRNVKAIEKTPEVLSNVPVSLLKSTVGTLEVIQEEKAVPYILSAANFLDAHIRSVVEEAIGGNLEDLISRIVDRRVSVLMREIYSGVSEEVSHTKVKKPRILISGLLHGQESRLKQEFGEFFTFVFHKKDHKASLLTPLLHNVDHVIIMTAVISHSISNAVAPHPSVFYCHGMVEDARKILLKLK